MTLGRPLLLYAAAFVLMLLAGVALGVSALGSLEALGLLWVSAGLSAAAMLVALAAVLVPRR